MAPTPKGSGVGPPPERRRIQVELTLPYTVRGQPVPAQLMPVLPVAGAPLPSVRTILIELGLA
jgi:hypothetical protein